MEEPEANVGYTLSVSPGILVLVAFGIFAVAAPRFLSAIK
jgi:hypothetical protein